jgi:hypothetical protein
MAKYKNANDKYRGCNLDENNEKKIGKSFYGISRDRMNID